MEATCPLVHYAHRAVGRLVALQIEVSRKIARDVELYCFSGELRQVFANLIGNAIDAMGGNGELRVRTYRDDVCAVVEIGDNGPGISPEVEPHIFEPFFTTKGVGEGTGLGLDAVQRIVRKHRGNIQVTSEPGDTRFQVWLPLAEATMPAGKNQK